MPKREYPDRPFVGVGVVIWRGNDLLLVRRGKEPRLNEWSIPGGAQHIGETLTETALREVREETSLTIELSGLIDVVDAIFPDQSGAIRNHYTLIDFSARWVSGEAVPGDDASEIAWVPLDRLKDYGLWDVTEKVIRQSAAKMS